jgi:hypothetical protein
MSIRQSVDRNTLQVETGFGKKLINLCTRSQCGASINAIGKEIFLSTLIPHYATAAPCSIAHTPSKIHIEEFGTGNALQKHRLHKKSRYKYTKNNKISVKFKK